MPIYRCLAHFNSLFKKFLQGASFFTSVKISLLDRFIEGKLLVNWYANFMFWYELLNFSQKKNGPIYTPISSWGPFLHTSSTIGCHQLIFVSVKIVLWCQEKLNKYITTKSQWFNTNRILSIMKIFSSNLVTKPFGTNVLEGCHRRRRETIFKCLDPIVTLYFLLPSVDTHHLPYLIAKGLRNIILLWDKKEKATVIGEYWKLQPCCY